MLPNLLKQSEMSKVCLLRVNNPDHVVIIIVVLCPTGQSGQITPGRHDEQVRTRAFDPILIPTYPRCIVRVESKSYYTKNTTRVKKPLESKLKSKILSRVDQVPPDSPPYMTTAFRWGSSSRKDLILAY